MEFDKRNKKVILSLGSNLGDRSKHLKMAIAFLEKELGIVKSKSSIFETEAWGNLNLNSFLNQVVEIETSFSPNEVLIITQQIELNLGRQKKTTNNYVYCNREIDIDILFYEDLILESDSLVIPHPQLQNRLFVLKPLMEIEPNRLHPVLQVTIQKLFEMCQDHSKAKKYKDG